MADAKSAWTIRIRGWRDFQNYKDRHPPWIKLHQARLLDKPEWRRLHGSAAKLLVDLWMLASGTKEGELTLRLPDLSYRLHNDEAETLSDLKVLQVCGFVELSPTLQTNSDERGISRTMSDKRNSEESRAETEESRAEPLGPAAPDIRPVGNWVTEFGAAWKARFEGVVPWKRIGHALKPLRGEYQDPEILSRWERYLSRVEGRYASPEDFAKKFGEWGGPKRSDNYLRPDEVA